MKVCVVRVCVCVCVCVCECECVYQWIMLLSHMYYEQVWYTVMRLMYS